LNFAPASDQKSAQAGEAAAARLSVSAMAPAFIAYLISILPDYSEIIRRGILSPKFRRLQYLLL
jgi:hypothetical protein